MLILSIVLVYLFNLPSYVGLFGIFKKAGITNWYAFIPGLNGYYAGDLTSRRFVTKVGSGLFSLIGIIYILILKNSFSLGQDTAGSMYLILTFFLWFSFISYARTLYFLFKAFGKGGFFSQTGVLLPFIFLPITGFDSSVYTDSKTQQVSV